MENSFSKKALKIPLDKRSKTIRKSIIKGIIESGRGHFGSAMSTVEILRVLYDDFMNYDPKNPKKEKRDRLILSKGHGCLSLYSILADKGFFSKKYLSKVGHPNSILGGHPEYLKVPGIEASTGALGHGLSIASGIALSLKIKKSKSKVFVILGDGEINEGSNWEAAMSASKHKLTNLKVFIDYNKIQSFGFTKNVVDLEPLSLKWKSFGFEVSEVNGHNIKQIKKNIKKFYQKKDKKPSLTICHTIKGKGFSFAENNPFWHHKNSFTQEDIKKFDESLSE